MKTSRFRVVMALLLFAGTALGAAPTASAAPSADIDRRMMNCYSSVTVLEYWRSERPGTVGQVAQARWTPTDTDAIRVPHGYLAEIDLGHMIWVIGDDQWYTISASMHGKCVFITTDDTPQSPPLT